MTELQTQGNFSGSPGELSRQIREMELRIKQSVDDLQVQLTSLKADLAELRAEVEGYHP